MILQIWAMKTKYIEEEIRRMRESFKKEDASEKKTFGV